MQHTDFFARIRAIKTEEYKELQAAVELHGGIYEWDLRNPEHPVIAVNLNGIIPAPADVRIYKVYIRKGMLKLCGVEKEYGEEQDSNRKRSLPGIFPPSLTICPR